LRAVVEGSIVVDGRAVTLATPRAAIDAGVLLAPEDRRLHGLILSDSVARNVSLPNLASVARFGWVDSRQESALADRAVEQLRIKTPSIDQPVGLLSGGNQQKVVFGKWQARGPKVLILDEPTRGVDVGARSEIYGVMESLAREGVAILMISSDMEEVLAMSDRVVVMHDGRIAGELSRDALSEEAIMQRATGRGHGQ
jgi:ribose transport system ATP-binding protein